MQITRIPEKDLGYLPSAIANRNKYDGRVGTIAEDSNSYGLFYRVHFGREGVACYEQEELSLLHPKISVMIPFSVRSEY